MNTPMNGAQIAKHIGITRQAVSYSIRKSMDKMYNYVLKNYADSPFEATIVLMKILGVNTGSISDIKDFISYFNKDIMNEIILDAESSYNTGSYSKT